MSDVLRRTITVNKRLASAIKKYLANEPKTEDECFNEDETVVVTAKYPDGYEVDIKMCGVQYDPDSSNVAYTEAVLFHNGAEVCCTEPSEYFFGTWCIETNEKTFIVDVEEFKDANIH